MTGEWWEYLVVFSASGALCVLLTPSAMRLAVQKNLFDHPGGHKSHDTAVPYLGGIAIVLAFAVTVGFAAAVKPPQSGQGELLIVFGLAVLMSLVGLVDDLRHVSPLWRIVAEVAASLVVWSIGSGVTVTGVEALDLGLTVLWIVGITNAFNLLDNMDGLASGIAAICSLTIFAIAVTNGQILVAALAVGLTGCTAGFLRSNFHPARIYMGDGGSLFIGFLIAYLGIRLRFEGDRVASALVPVFACSAAVFDTTLVVISRMKTGRSPFHGGQDHVSHRLVRLGLPVPYAVGTIYLGAVSIGALAYVMSGIDSISAWILAGTIVLTLTALGGALLRVSVVYATAEAAGSVDATG